MSLDNYRNKENVNKLFIGWKVGEATKKTIEGLGKWETVIKKCQRT